MEQQLLKLLLTKENFDKYSQYLEEKHFVSASSSKRIGWDTFLVIKDYFSSNDEDLSVPGLRSLHLTKLSGATQERLEAVNDFYAMLEQEQVTQAAESLVRTLRINGLAWEAQDFLDEGKWDRAASKIEQIQQIKQEELGTQFDITDVCQLQEEFEANTHYRWGISELDEYLNGFGPERSVLFFARPNTGKTSTLVVNAVDFMRQGAKVLHFAISEDTSVALVRRYYQAAYNITDEELDCNTEYYSDVFKEEFGGKLFIKNVPSIRLNQARNFIQACEPDIVIFDQYQKVKVFHDQESRSDEVLTLVAQKLKELAKEFGFGLVCATQASAEADNRQWLSLSSVAGSKTGVPGEFQSMVGVGAKTNEMSKPRFDKDGNRYDCKIRYFNICKNKGKEGRFEKGLESNICMWV